MRKFNKVFILKIVSLSINILLLFTNIIYSYSAPQKYLRLPVGKIDDTLDRVKNKIAPTAIVDYKEKLQKYLGDEKLSNTPRAIEKVISILENYSQRGKRIILKIGGGRAVIASDIARRNENAGVITTDIYNIDDRYYGKNAEDFEKGELDAQQLNLENLAIIRADTSIFKFLPAESIDYVLFVSPSGYLNDVLLSEELYKSIKVGGKILIKPWYNFDKSYAYGNPPETIFYAPREVSYKGRSFINTNSSIAFGVDLDNVSDSPSDRPVFEWQKKRKSEEGKAAMLDLSALTPREHNLLNQALESLFNNAQDMRVLTDKELARIDPYSDLRKVKDLKVYTFTKQQLRKALQYNTTAKKREADYIVNNLISHPGRFRTVEAEPRATNLFILKEHYRAIRGLDENLKALWAAHEREHLENIALAESEVGEIHSLYNVIKALEKKVSRKTKFINKPGLKQVMRLIIARLKDKKKPLLICIDGDSRTGKTVLSDDVALLLPADIRYKIIHIDDYHVLEYSDHLSGDLTAYIDQFGSSGSMMLEREYWDYGKAGDEIKNLAGSGQFDVIILEGLNSLYVEKFNHLSPVRPHFDIKIHLVADQETREYIYMKRFTSEVALLNMKNYLNSYVQKYPVESVNYDIIIDNSFSSVDAIDAVAIQINSGL